MSIDSPRSWIAIAEPSPYGILLACAFTCLKLALPKPPEPISQSLPSECLAITMSSGLISHEDEGTTSGRLDAPLYCLQEKL